MSTRSQITQWGSSVVGTLEAYRSLNDSARTEDNLPHIAGPRRSLSTRRPCFEPGCPWSTTAAKVTNLA